MSEATCNDGRDETYAVVWPSGRSVESRLRSNNAAGSLSGKTVAFIWDYLFKGDEMFDAIREAIESQYDGVRFVGHESFGNIHGSDVEEREALELLPAQLKEMEVDAAVVAVGA